MRWQFIAALAATTAGCVTTSGDTVSFQAQSYQQAIMRDGDPIVSSRGKHSVVSLRPATHLISDRPVFIVGIQNTSKQKLEFRVTDLTAGQIVGSNTNALRIYTYDELVGQERSAQVGRAILTSVLQGVNSGLVGDDVAADTNAQMAANTAATNATNMAELEQLALKDHTLMPGENYAGKLYLQAPETASGPKTYSIGFKVGPDRHDFQVIQTPVAQ
jgi:hypothetical protein